MYPSDVDKAAREAAKEVLRQESEGLSIPINSKTISALLAAGSIVVSIGVLFYRVEFLETQVEKALAAQVQQRVSVLEREMQLMETALDKLDQKVDEILKRLPTQGG